MYVCVRVCECEYEWVYIIYKLYYLVNSCYGSVYKLC